MSLFLFLLSFYVTIPGAETWKNKYPTCGGRSQSPINIKSQKLIATNARALVWKNYKKVPESMTLANEGITGKDKKK